MQENKKIVTEEATQCRRHKKFVYEIYKFCLNFLCVGGVFFFFSYSAWVLIYAPLDILFGSECLVSQSTYLFLFLLLFNAPPRKFYFCGQLQFPQPLSSLGCACGLLNNEFPWDYLCVYVWYVNIYTCVCETMGRGLLGTATIALRWRFIVLSLRGYLHFVNKMCNTFDEASCNHTEYVSTVESW